MIVFSRRQKEKETEIEYETLVIATSDRESTSTRSRSRANANEISRRSYILLDNLSAVNLSFRVVLADVHILACSIAVLAWEDLAVFWTWPVAAAWVAVAFSWIIQ